MQLTEPVQLPNPTPARFIWLSNPIPIIKIKLLSSTTTTQKVQAAHVLDPSTITMPATANKRYDDAPFEPYHHGNASNELL